MSCKSFQLVGVTRWSKVKLSEKNKPKQPAVSSDSLQPSNQMTNAVNVTSADVMYIHSSRQVQPL